MMNVCDFGVPAAVLFMYKTKNQVFYSSAARHEMMSLVDSVKISTTTIGLAQDVKVGRLQKVCANIHARVVFV
jgi:hypothetical protein